MKQLLGTSKTFMPQGLDQQLLEFSVLVQNLRFQELPLPGGCSFPPSSVAAGLSCASGKPSPCPTPACPGLLALMQKRVCQQQAVPQAQEQNLLPLSPSFPIAPSWLLFWEGTPGLRLSARLSLAAKVEGEGQKAPEQQ